MIRVFKLDQKSKIDQELDLFLDLISDFELTRSNCVGLKSNWLCKTIVPGPLCSLQPL